MLCRSILWLSKFKPHVGQESKTIEVLSALMQTSGDTRLQYKHPLQPPGAQNPALPRPALPRPALPLVRTALLLPRLLTSLPSPKTNCRKGKLPTDADCQRKRSTNFKH
jgi:hypothetical protein